MFAITFNKYRNPTHLFVSQIIFFCFIPVTGNGNSRKIILTYIMGSMRGKAKFSQYYPYDGMMLTISEVSTIEEWRIVTRDIIQRVGEWKTKWT